MVFLAVVGPTSSGKSDVALMLAQQLGGEIVCCDSVQVYRGFDIGSAKPSRADQAKVPHHLFNILEWHETFDAATYAVKAKECILDIEGRGKIPIVTGGSGLYLRSLISDRWNDDLPNDPALRDMLRMRSSIELYAELRQKDPRRAAEIHVNDRFRVVRALEIVLLTGKPVPQAPESLPGQARHVTIVMEPPRENLLQKIAERTRLMLANGLVREVEGLLSGGVSKEAKPMQSIGYAEVVSHLGGEISLEFLEESIVVSTRQYAKRQVTWFNKVDRAFSMEFPDEAEGVVPQLLDRLNSVYNLGT